MGWLWTYQSQFELTLSIISDSDGIVSNFDVNLDFWSEDPPCTSQGGRGSFWAMIFEFLIGVDYLIISAVLDFVWPKITEKKTGIGGLGHSVYLTENLV